MVKVINVTGEAVAANTNIDLGGYLEDKIAQLVKARLLSRATQTVTLTGSAAAAHTHALTVDKTVATVTTVIALGNSGGLLVGTCATSMPGCIGAAGALTPAGTISQVGGLVFADKTVDNTGLLVSSGTTCASGHAALSDRTAIILGDALASNAILELTVLGQKDFGGLV